MMFKVDYLFLFLIQDNEIDSYTASPITYLKLITNIGPLPTNINDYFAFT